MKSKARKQEAELKGIQADLDAAVKYTVAGDRLTAKALARAAKASARAYVIEALREQGHGYDEVLLLLEALGLEGSITNA